MTDETRPFWADPVSPTEAYARPPKVTWRQAVEARITWVRSLYDTIDEWHSTVWDYAPAIAAVATLVWLTIHFHR